MRPLGEVAQAILKAASDLVTPDRGPTVAELAERACVGRKVANDTVKNLKRRGALSIVREREVDYRNKPVAEYAPAEAEGIESRAGHGWVDLNRCVDGWAR